MRGEVSHDGKTLSLATLVRDGHATVCGSACSYPLQPGMRCRVEHQAVTFFVNVVPPEAPPRLGLQFSRPFWAFTARSLALFASVLVWVYFATPTTGEADVAVDERLVNDSIVAFAGPFTPEPGLATDRLDDALANGASGPRAENPGNAASVRGGDGGSSA